MLTALLGAAVVDDLRSLAADAGVEPLGELVPRAAAALLYLAVVMALAWGRRWAPLPFLALLGVSLLLDPSPALALLICLLLAVASYALPVPGLTVMVASALIWIVVTASRHSDTQLWMLWLVPIALLALIPGWTVRVMVERNRADRAAAAQRHREAQEREEALVQRTREDRARLARELHDVVAHELTRIAMQSNLGQMSGDPDEQRESLAAISRSSRNAMSEMRRLVRIIGGDERSESEAVAGSGVASMRVSDELDRAAAYLRDAGFQATTDLHGEEEHVPRSLIPTASIVLREATTNVVKHTAPGVPCAVDAAVTAGDLVLEVRNRLTHAVLEPPASGVGLAGLRARLADLGGTLDVDHRDSWWVLRATLPLAQDD